MKMKRKVDAVVDFNCDDVIEWMETTDESLSFSQAEKLYMYAAKLIEKTLRMSSAQRVCSDWLDLKSSEKEQFIKWIKEFNV